MGFKVLKIQEEATAMAEGFHGVGNFPLVFRFRDDHDSKDLDRTLSSSLFNSGWSLSIQQHSGQVKGTRMLISRISFSPHHFYVLA